MLTIERARRRRRRVVGVLLLSYRADGGGRAKVWVNDCIKVCCSSEALAGETTQLKRGVRSGDGCRRTVYLGISG